MFKKVIFWNNVCSHVSQVAEYLEEEEEILKNSGDQVKQTH